MSDIWSYTLDDFLLFSPRVYYRMLELHNQTLWPMQVPAIVLGLAIILIAVRPGAQRDRVAFAICGMAWLSLAWSFFWQRYAPINWAAAYIAPVAALEGIVLLWLGSLRGTVHIVPPTSTRAQLGVGLLMFAIVAYPLIAVGVGRPLLSGEVFGLMPDPTAIATLALLSLSTGRWRWLVMLVPVLWCVVTGMTLWGLKAPEWFVAPVCGFTCLLVAGSVRDRAKRPETA